MSTLIHYGLPKAILIAFLIIQVNAQLPGIYKTTFFDYDMPHSGKMSLEANPCLSMQTCGDCIRASPQCAWCTEPGNFTYSRCDTQYNWQNRKCHSSHIYSPMPTMEKIQDDPLANPSDDNNDEPIQMQPQRISLRLRPNFPYTFNVTFKQARDYPVDLYYLMDLSKSMEDDKEKLAKLGHELAEKMRTLTSNFRLGFGSFVDKVVMPYVSTVPEKLNEPCSQCAAPYGFKNHMKLDVSSEDFVSKVNGTQISGNLDAPEGGFDAIMQAIVCKEDIGWREKSRKLLVYSTDAGFHYAGDGKLGGIVKPNDGECHLDQDGMYTESITQDYPSISQINRKVQEHHVNIIFAVTASQIHIYQQLTGNSNSSISLIEGASSGELEQDSSNVVQLIENEYKKITSTIELKDNATSNVRITYSSSCLNTKQQTNICSGLRVGDQVSFDVTLTVESCPSNPIERNQTIKIYPVGLTDALYIDLSMICDCECEQPWNQQIKSSECNYNGVYQCGICNCQNNHYGRRCECDAKDSNPEAEEASCFRGNDTKVCSGRGNCRCGECECFKRDASEEITGKFCECDNFSCDRYDGKVCAGPDHGTCVCGRCECKEGWTSSDCSCKKSQQDCVNPKNGKVCSGRGTCRCGQCECEEFMTGIYCEDCLNCKEKCDVYKDCVQCRIYPESSSISKEDCKNCTINPIGVSEFIEQIENEEICFVRDENDCTFNFKYYYSEPDNAVVVIAQNQKNCPKPVDFLAIVIGVIAGIVLIGLAFLVIWKLLTTIKDRREVAKFNEEQMKAKWETGVNPIFKKATTTFKNPTYNGK